jgi:hypothetical protein
MHESLLDDLDLQGFIELFGGLSSNAFPAFQDDSLVLVHLGVSILGPLLLDDLIGNQAIE